MEDQVKNQNQLSEDEQALLEAGRVLATAVTQGGDALQHFVQWFQQAAAQHGHKVSVSLGDGVDSGEGQPLPDALKLPDEDYASENEKALAQYLSRINAAIMNLERMVTENVGRVKQESEIARQLPDLRRKTGIPTLTEEQVLEAIRETNIQHPYYALVEKYGLSPKAGDLPMRNGSALDLQSVKQLSPAEIAALAEDNSTKATIARLLEENRKNEQQKQLEAARVGPAQNHAGGQGG